MPSLSAIFKKTKETNNPGKIGLRKLDVKEDYLTPPPSPPPPDPGNIGLSGDNKNNTPSELHDDQDKYLYDTCKKYEEYDAEYDAVSAPDDSCVRVGRKCKQHQCSMTRVVTKVKKWLKGGKDGSYKYRTVSVVSWGCANNPQPAVQGSSSRGLKGSTASEKVLEGGTAIACSNLRFTKSNPGGKRRRD